MKKLVLVLLTSTTFLTSYSQTEKTEKIQSLINILGTDSRIEKTLNELINSQTNNASTSDTIFWKKYKTKFISVLEDSIKPEVITVYDKYFSEEEINAMHEFYTSDIGKRTLVKLNNLTQEIMKLGFDYGRNISNQILKEEEEKAEKEINYKINNEYSGCEKFRVGKFKYVLNDSTVYYFERNSSKQIETLGEGKSVYKINWLNDCKYELILENTNNPYMSNQIGAKMTVNIYETLSDRYKYVYKYGNSPKIYNGKLIQIE